jgi:hypothetical protein
MAPYLNRFGRKMGHKFTHFFWKRGGFSPQAME